MAAAAHNFDIATRAGIPQEVAREYNKADTGTAMLRRAAQHANVLKGKRNG